MSSLVECVPNFSEGNNQEVRCWWVGGRRWGACLLGGLGTASGQKGRPLSAHRDTAVSVGDFDVTGPRW